jgi:hypothetical protein
MCTRRESRKFQVALLAALALSLMAPSQAYAAELYGMVVGIDDYIGTVNDLDGAVNDASDVAKSLNELGAKEVVTLFNGDATKEHIFSSWNELVTKAEPGDTIVFSYAGHGGQEPEPPGRHDEADGMNENFLLGGFAAEGPGTKQRILDDEVFEWMKEADDKKVKVIFVADSCHSGGMERSASASGVKFRKGRFAAIAGDQLTFPPEKFAQMSETDFQNVTFVGAVAEDKLTPEVTIEGRKRGALSWAFARALEGRADKDGDGEVSEFELLGFIVPAVHAMVESQQTPSVLPLRARSVPLVTLRETKAPAKESGDDLKLKIAVDGGDAGPLGELPFVTIVDDKAKADLVWSPSSGKVEHVVGGVVAENVNAEAIKGVASKWAALKWLNAQAALAPVEAKLETGNQRYAPGDLVKLDIDGAKYPHLTLFNLPPDGHVEFFIPNPTKLEEAKKDWSREPIRESFKVDKPPFGAEHMVAIFSKDEISDLNAALSGMTTPERAEALRPVLEQALSGHDVQIGVIDIYTGGGG